MKAAAVLLALAALPAQAQEWSPIVAARTGELVSIWLGSVSTRVYAGTPTASGLVRVEKEGEPDAVYIASVPLAHCGAERGDITLTTPEGELFSRSVFIARTKTAGSLLAAALCKEIARRRS